VSAPSGTIWEDAKVVNEDADEEGEQNAAAFATKKAEVQALPDGAAKTNALKSLQTEEEALQNAGWGAYVGLKKLFTKDTKRKKALTPEEIAKEAEKKRKLESKSKVKSLVDGKRGLKGGILLSAFKGDFTAVRQALLQGNAAFLTLSRVEALLEIVPTEQELPVVLPQPELTLTRMAGAPEHPVV